MLALTRPAALKGGEVEGVALALVLDGSGVEVPRGVEEPAGAELEAGGELAGGGAVG